MIGRIGARRALALLVVGDAVLGGALLGVVLRPGDEPPDGARVVASTTVPAPAVGSLRPAVADVEPGAVTRGPTAPQPSASTTTVVPTTVPPTTRGEVPSTGPTVAGEPSTTTVPSATLPPPTSAPPTTADALG
jgi:hypothetical protein